MEIKIKLYGSSKMLSDKGTLNIQLPNNSNILKINEARLLDILVFYAYGYCQTHEPQ